MTTYAGSALVVKIDGTAISKFRKVDTNEKQNVVDGTSGADAYETSIKTTKKITGSLTVLDQDGAGGSAIRAALQPGSFGTLEWGPFGADTGDPKYGLYVMFTGISRPFDFKSEQVFTIDWEGAASTGWASHYENSGSTWT